MAKKQPSRKGAKKQRRLGTDRAFGQSLKRGVRDFKAGRVVPLDVDKL